MSISKSVYFKQYYNAKAFERVEVCYEKIFCTTTILSDVALYGRV